MLRSKFYDPKYSGKPLAVKALGVRYMSEMRCYLPSLSGVVVILLVLFIIVDHISRNSNSKEQFQTNGKVLDMEPQNPKIKGVNDLIHALVTDPQEQEFQAVIQHNQQLKEGDALQVPMFNPNVHIKEKHEKLSHQNPEWKTKVVYPNPKQFPVAILKEPRLECDQPLTLLLLVHTYTNNFGARKAIRQTWGTQIKNHYERFGPGIRWKTIFVLGKGEEEGVGEKEVREESHSYGDILQANFTDNKHEDTRKFMTGLHWLPDHIQNCKPTYIMKTTDRIFHNMFSIIDWLDAKYGANPSPIYVGKLLRKDRPIRDTNDPMYVSMADYANPFFPDMIQGPVYLFDFNTYLSLASRMRHVTPIALEDAYVGLLAEQARIKPKHNDHFQMLQLTSNTCHNLRIFFIFDINAYKHIEILDKNFRARQSNECPDAKVINPKNNRAEEIRM